MSGLERRITNPLEIHISKGSEGVSWLTMYTRARAYYGVIKTPLRTPSKRLPAGTKPIGFSSAAAGAPIPPGGGSRCFLGTGRHPIRSTARPSTTGNMTYGKASHPAFPCLGIGRRSEKPATLSGQGGAGRRSAWRSPRLDDAGATGGVGGVLCRTAMVECKPCGPCGSRRDAPRPDRGTGLPNIRDGVAASVWWPARGAALGPRGEVSKSPLKGCGNRGLTKFTRAHIPEQKAPGGAIPCA